MHHLVRIFTALNAFLVLMVKETSNSVLSPSPLLLLHHLVASVLFFFLLGHSS